MDGGGYLQHFEGPFFISSHLRMGGFAHKMDTRSFEEQY
jgi:hypothetical protein